MSLKAKSMAYYKVLYRLKNGWRLSAGKIPDSLRLTYQKGKTTRSKVKNGKLFVFQDFKEADLFTHDIGGSNLEIWEVEVSNPKPIIKAVQLWRPYNLPMDYVSVVIDFWNGKERESYTAPICYGVSAVDSITLIKKVTS